MRKTPLDRAHDTANGVGATDRPPKASRINRDGLPVGTRAPDFRLPQLDGRPLSLADYRGRRVLIVFSDPMCGPCNALAPELERIHRSSQHVAILMISRGDLDANRSKVAEDSLTFPIVRQRQWEISRAYGMFATPIAYLVDDQGVITSNVAVGPEAILTLAGGVDRSVQSLEEERRMRERIAARLAVLKREFDTGRLRLEDLKAQQASLHDTMVRISGAIQVLEELLAQPPASESVAGPAPSRSDGV